MKSLAFLFPGQGSQTPGMGAAFAATTAGKHLLEHADDTLGFKLSTLMLEGPAEELTQTENTQPALLVAGLLAHNYLISQSKTSPTFVAGHSLGEYTALAAAGAQSFEVMLKAVRLRGIEMAKVTGGAMAAVLGLPTPQIPGLDTSTWVVANDNSPGQVVISGPAATFEQAEAAAKLAGAKRILRLNVSGAFHTPAMVPTGLKMAEFFAEHPLQSIPTPCIMNTSAAPESAAPALTAALIAQTSSPVRWRESMTFLANQGITQVLELGVGKVLTALAPRCDPRLSAVSLDSPATVDAWLETHFK